MEDQAKHTLLTGQAGVFQVASQLNLRGMTAQLSFPDFGVDLYADGYARIQVKSAHLRHHRRYYPEGAYWFKFWQSAIVTGSNNIRRRGRKNYDGVVDFLVLWGIDQNRFWVVPVKELEGAQLVVVGPDVWHHELDLEVLQKERESGKTIREIADAIGVSPTTVQRRLVGEFTEPKLTISSRVRACENRWDLIESFVRTMTEEIVPESAPVEKT